MTLTELKRKVDEAIESAIEYGDTPDDIMVSLQIEKQGVEKALCSTEVELHYDNDTQASGCVLLGLIGWES